MTAAADSDPAEQDNLANSHGNAAAAIVSQLKENADGQPRARRPIEGLEDDENAPSGCIEKEFISTKASRVAKRKWEAEQKEKGNLPKNQTPSQSVGTRAILLICSTLGMLLFGYRMYLRHSQSSIPAYVRFLLDMSTATCMEPSLRPKFSTSNHGPLHEKNACTTGCLETFMNSYELMQYIYTPEQLAKHGASSRSIWVGIAGEIYDVSSARNFYGAKGGYSFFAGTDASRAYLTGKFQDDLNDDVEDFTDEQFHGLMHWKDFYLKEYKYKGRLVGAFFDEQGFPTALSRRMWEASARHKGAVEERKNKRLSYPDCSTRWSSNSGSELWCNDGLYPRKLTEMVAGKAEQRCACFKEMGWSNLRQVYPGCKPDKTRCKLQPKAEAQAEEGAKDGDGQQAEEQSTEGQKTEL